MKAEHNVLLEYDGDSGGRRHQWSRRVVGWGQTWFKWLGGRSGQQPRRLKTLAEADWSKVCLSREAETSPCTPVVAVHW